tara:strand:+ start:409 stop:2709 length:2301 start_codon:yes stop_codon:yes gene_type:complete
MSNIYPIYTDRTRYKLNHNPTGQQTVQEPKGFRDDDNEYVRDKSFHGIFPQMTNNLTFYNDGGYFIENIYSQYGINAEIILTKEERNPKTDIWEQSYTGFLDLSTYSKENEGVSIKFVSSGLLRVIKARQNEKIELDRLDTLNGDTIPYLEPSEVALDGRDILLKSLLETQEIDSSTDNFSMRFQTKNSRTASLAVPMAEIYSSDVKIFAPNEFSFTSTPDIGRVESLFYLPNDRDKILNINIKCGFDIVQPSSIDISDISSDANLRLYLVIFENGESYNVKDRIPLSGNIIYRNGLRLTRVDASYVNSSFELLTGESLSLQWYGGASSWGSFVGPVGISYGYIRPRFDNIISSINIIEDSEFDGTKSKVHFPFEIASRFLKLFTNQDDILVSNVLGKTENGYSEDGEASLIAMAHGFWIRGFSKDDDVEINEENRYKSMTTNFKEFYESYFDVWSLGAGIEKVGFKEIFRIEKLDYFYNKNVLIRLGKVVDGRFEYVQVSNVKRSLNKDEFISGIEIGYDKGGDYEEAVGLDEYNTKTTFTTVIDKIEQKYKATSKYRADSYGAEFARRKSYFRFPTEDTKYDNSIWLFDLIRNPLSVIFKQRLWQDDFSEEPTGVFSPDTAQNLRLSPFNILLRHGWRIGSGLVKYPLNFIRYGSSIANSSLTTKLKLADYPQYGGVAYSENGNILNKDLEQARTDGEVIEFDYYVDYDLLQKVQGKTVILGKEIQNFYGLISFKNENGDIEEGYLDKLSPNGVGKWTIKRFNN